MIVSWNFYYARPGNESAVLQQRIRASDLREQLGLPRGRIISKIEGSVHWPDVAWRLDFADMQAQDADMKARADSTEFEAIRLGMRQLYQRFERPLYAATATANAAAGSQTAPELSLMVYGLYCDEPLCPAVRAVLDSHPYAEFISGGADVPRFIVETGEAGIESRLLEQLRRLPMRIEYSLCRVAGQH